MVRTAISRLQKQIKAFWLQGNNKYDWNYENRHKNTRDATTLKHQQGELLSLKTTHPSRLEGKILDQVHQFISTRGTQPSKVS